MVQPTERLDAGPQNGGTLADVTAMTPGDRTHRNVLMRISDLTVNSDVIADQVFENCKIVGPALLVPGGPGNEFHGCLWLGEPDAVIWEIAPERVFVVGAIGLTRCRFYNCTFERIGMGLDAEGADKFRTEVLQKS